MQLAHESLMEMRASRARQLAQEVAMMAALPNDALVAGPQGVIKELPVNGGPVRHFHSSTWMHSTPYARPSSSIRPSNLFVPRVDNSSAAASRKQRLDNETSEAAEGLLSLSPFNSPQLLADARSLSTCVDLLATPDLIGISHPIPQEQLSQSHSFWSRQDHRPHPSLQVLSPHVTASQPIPTPSPTPTSDEGIRGTPEESKSKLFFSGRHEKLDQCAAGSSPTSGMGSMLRIAGPQKTAPPCLPRRPSLTMMDMLAGR